MQNLISPEDFVYLKYLLGIIGALVGSQVILLIFFAKKYIKRADVDHEKLIMVDLIEIKKDHDLLHRIFTEHKSFHKSETGI